MPSQDYEEFIGALNAHGVRYLVIDAHTVAFHARPRATKDLDILLEPTAENAHRALAALREFFGDADLGYTVDDLINPRWIVQLGIAPIRIDLLSGIPRITDFEAVWRNRVDAYFGTVSVHYLGLDDLLQAKEAAGKPQDRADVRVLQRAKGKVQSTQRSSRRSSRSR